MSIRTYIFSEVKKVTNTTNEVNELGEKKNDNFVDTKRKLSKQKFSMLSNCTLTEEGIKSARNYVPPKMSQKQRKYVLKNLMKDRANFLAEILKKHDNKTNLLISQKIYNVTQKIQKLLNEDCGYKEKINRSSVRSSIRNSIIDNNKKDDNFNEKYERIYSSSARRSSAFKVNQDKSIFDIKPKDKNTNQMIKKLDKKLKYEKLKKDVKIMEYDAKYLNIINVQNKPKINNIKLKQNKVFFEREQKTYNTSSEFFDKNFTTQKSTLYMKVFKPKGFLKNTNSSKISKSLNLPNTFDEVYSEIKKEKKLRRKRQYHRYSMPSVIQKENINNQSNKVMNDIRQKIFMTDINKINDDDIKINRKNSTFSIKNEKILSINDFKQKIKNIDINDQFNQLTYHPYSSRHFNKNSNKKTLILKIKRALNDGLIIENSMKKTMLKKEKIKKNDHEKLLLELEKKLKGKKYEQIKENDELKDIRNLKDEELYALKLSKVPKGVKHLFRKIFKELLYQKRILNLWEQKKLTRFEKEISNKHLNEEIKKESMKKMQLCGENFVTVKDEKSLENGIGDDFYGNIEGLELLLKKRKYVSYLTQFVGAFNTTNSFTKLNNIQYQFKK